MRKCVKALGTAKVVRIKMEFLILKHTHTQAQSLIYRHKEGYAKGVLTFVGLITKTITKTAKITTLRKGH